MANNVRITSQISIPMNNLSLFIIKLNQTQQQPRRILVITITCVFSSAFYSGSLTTHQIGDFSLVTLRILGGWLTSVCGIQRMRCITVMHYSSMGSDAMNIWQMALLYGIVWHARHEVHFNNTPQQVCGMSEDDVHYSNVQQRCIGCQNFEIRGCECGCEYLEYYKYRELLINMICILLLLQNTESVLSLQVYNFQCCISVSIRNAVVNYFSITVARSRVEKV